VAGGGTLYIVDENDHVHGYKVDSGRWSAWEVNGRVWSISVSQCGDVLITSRSSRQLLEYTLEG